MANVWTDKTSIVCLIISKMQLSQCHIAYFWHQTIIWNTCTCIPNYLQTKSKGCLEISCAIFKTKVNFFAPYGQRCCRNTAQGKALHWWLMEWWWGHVSLCLMFSRLIWFGQVNRCGIQQNRQSPISALFNRRPADQIRPARGLQVTREGRTTWLILTGY